MLQKLTRHPKFEEFFGEALRRILLRGTGSGTRSGCLHVVFYCKKGRHRSVGLAYLAAIALSVLTNWGADTLHLADHAWQFDTCNNCHSCARPTGELRKAKQEAVDFAVAVARKAVADFLVEI